MLTENSCKVCEGHKYFADFMMKHKISQISFEDEKEILCCLCHEKAQMFDHIEINGKLRHLDLCYKCYFDV